MEMATSGDNANAARWANLLLGSWLFVSAFLWPHTTDLQTNTWMVGMMVATFSLLALGLPGARKANAVLAVWLFLSTLVMARSEPATLANNCLIAVAIFLLSLIPPGSLGRRDVPEQYVGVW
jgi:hypothetical protein